jgi:MFS family permease
VSVYVLFFVSTLADLYSLTVLGLFIGALFVQYASWRWVFWFAALIAVPLAGLCAWLVPPQTVTEDRAQPAREKLRRLDLPGVSMLTATLVLFIFAITSGSTAGWGSAMVLAPLVVSVLMVIVFFVYETRIPEQYAAMSVYSFFLWSANLLIINLCRPPRMWFFPSFAVLFGAALIPYFYWTTIFTIYTTLWQNYYHISAIMTAVHMLPIGVLAFAVSFSGRLARHVHPKWLILGGQIATLASAILFVFADEWSKYWSLVFPAFCIGTAGAMMAYVHNKYVSSTCSWPGACADSSFPASRSSAQPRHPCPALSARFSMVPFNSGPLSALQR